MHLNTNATQNYTDYQTVQVKPRLIQIFVDNFFVLLIKQFLVLK